MKKILIIAVSLLVTIALGLGLLVLVRSQLASSQQAKATETAQKFVEALVDNKPEAAYALMDNKGKSTITVAEFKELYKDAALADPTYISDTITKVGDSHYLVVRVVSGYPEDSNGANEVTYSVALANESGSWKVSTLPANFLSEQ